MNVAMDTFTVGKGEQAIFNSKVWFEGRNGHRKMMYMQVSVFVTRYEGVLVSFCKAIGDRQSFNMKLGMKSGVKLHRTAVEIDYNADGTCVVRVPRNTPKCFREPKRFQIFT